METDFYQTFVLPQAHVRGRLVRLKEVSSEIAQQHDYPRNVAGLLSEFTAGAVALATLLKYEGIFTLQTRTKGPMSLSVVDVTSQGNVRGYVQYDEERIEKAKRFQDIMGQGQIAFTVDQGVNLDRYQGIVPLEKETLAQCLEEYFRQSEQLETRIIIQSHGSKENEWQAVALLLQQLPASLTEETDEDTWPHIDAILNTLKTEETFDFSLPPQEFLYRLFNEFDLEVYEPQPVKAQCRCSKERIKDFLASLSPQEIEECLENGVLNMTCEFCNQHYTFKRNEILKIH